MGDGVRVGELCSPHGVGPVCQFARIFYLRMHEDLADRFRQLLQEKLNEKGIGFLVTQQY